MSYLATDNGVFVNSAQVIAVQYVTGGGPEYTNGAQEPIAYLRTELSNTYTITGVDFKRLFKALNSDADFITLAALRSDLPINPPFPGVAS